MIKEYYDTFLDKDAVTELNRDIEENPKENNSSCQKNI